MTKKDYSVIARVLNNLRNKLSDGSLDRLEEFDVVQWLIDEFAYRLEDDNPRFDEAKFRDAILGDNGDALLCVYPNCDKLQTADGEFCDEHYDMPL